MIQILTLAFFALSQASSDESSSSSSRNETNSTPSSLKSENLAPLPKGPSAAEPKSPSPQITGPCAAEPKSPTPQIMGSCACAFPEPKSPPMRATAKERKDCISKMNQANLSTPPRILIGNYCKNPQLSPPPAPKLLPHSPPTITGGSLNLGPPAVPVDQVFEFSPPPAPATFEIPDIRA